MAEVYPDRVGQSATFDVSASRVVLSGSALTDLRSVAETVTDGDLSDGDTSKALILEAGTAWAVVEVTYDHTNTRFDVGATLSSKGSFSSSTPSVSVYLVSDAALIAKLLTPESIQFDTTSTIDASQGELTWNSDEETLDLGLGDAVLQLGQEVHIHVRNNTGSDIPNGTPVMATGTLGASGRITVAPMDGTDPANAKYLIGVTTQVIAAGEDGKVAEFGKVRGLDTSGYSEGDVLWISAATAGALTATEPDGSELGIPVAMVVNSHAVNGTIFVRTIPVDEHLLGAGFSWTFSTITPTTSNVTATVGTWYRADISGLTANRQFILPACSAGDDPIAIEITTGDADYELVIQGDTGVTGSVKQFSATAGEITRLFITDELMIWTPVGTNTWQCTYDGRIAQSCRLDSSGGSTQSTTSGSWATVTNMTNIARNVGGIADAVNSRIYPRRKGTYLLSVSTILEALTGHTRVDCRTDTASTSACISERNYTSAATGSAVASAPYGFDTATENYFYMRVLQDDGVSKVILAAGSHFLDVEEKL